ncbi:hypothetical protein [Bacillus wiedmannii]|uniref:hypothetical protein n=1 Tax=Bacillus wiedmannii TaxID=1890302 RepID=UPI00159B9602|nr:hypothetical protein [Bacillus wiedmannii]
MKLESNYIKVQGLLRGIKERIEVKGKYKKNSTIIVVGWYTMVNRLKWTSNCIL